MSEEKALLAVRDKIDTIDRKIQQLLNARTACAQEVAKIKVANGEQSDFYRPEREAMVLRNVMARNDGPLPAKDMARLFREIMSACLATERLLKVAYLGPEGSFTQAAAAKQFGGSVEPNLEAPLPMYFTLLKWAMQVTVLCPLKTQLKAWYLIL